MTALDYMTSEGRRPSFGRVGGRGGGFTVTSLRSRPGAPQATPPEGLGPPPGAGSGTNAMGASSWVNTFRKTGSAMQRQALAERVQIPGMTGTQMFSGISQPIVNEFMAKAPSFGAVGMLTNPWTAPFGTAIMGNTPAPTATATPAPTVAQTPFTAPEPPPFDWTATIGNGTKSFSRTGTPQIQSRYGYAANVAPSFSWNRAFMNG